MLYNSLKIYNCSPNPVNNNQFVNLEWSDIAGENAIISINDLFGNEIFKTNQITTSNQIQSTKLDVSSIMNGVYFIRIKTLSESAVRKLIKYE